MRRRSAFSGFALLLLAIAATTARGQEQKAPASKPAPPPPSVDQILNKYVQALGGKSAIEKLNSRVSKGTFEIPDQAVSGTYESYAKAPNKLVSIVDIPTFGQLRQVFDGAAGWAENPQQGVREMSGQELATAKRSAEFHQVLKLQQLYAKMTLKGTDKVGERDTYLVEADPGDGSLRRMYFDTQSGLLVRNTLERDGPEGRVNFDSYLEDYRETEGVKVPYRVRQTNPNVSFVITLTEVHHNVPVDDAKFSKPASN